MSNKNTSKNIKERFKDTYTEVGAIAKFYGFQPITAPEITKEDLRLQKVYANNPLVAEISALLNTYNTEGGAAASQPLTLWYERPLKGGTENKKPKKYSFSLISMGSNKSVVECLSVQCMASILKSLGQKNIEIKLNSIGDKESISDFDRKVNAFIRKNMQNFSNETRGKLKNDIYAYLDEVTESDKKWDGDVPFSIDHLSEQSRNHFKEVLEFLEILGINYNLDHKLLGFPEWSGETVIDIIDPNENEVLVNGIKTSKLSKKIGFKKEVSVCILTASVKINKNLSEKRHKEKRPSFYLVQFGPEAKIKSFLVLEQIRSANVDIMHSLAKDKLAGQMTAVANLGIPYIILLGQKEAFEDSVIVRSVENRHEEKVPINQLSEYIKKLNTK